MSEANRLLGNTTKLGSAGDFIALYGNTAMRFYLLSVARELLPNYRINVCWRYPLPGKNCIEIIYSEELSRARASGTMKCGSAWVCPACMMHIQERRRIELARAMDRSKDDYFSVLVTYTASHTIEMTLRGLLDGMQKAFRRVKTGRIWQTVKQEYMLVGSVRATEITYGDSGWHPHFHELMFIDKKMLEDGYTTSPADYAQSLYSQMEGRWLDALQSKGLGGKTGIALDVRASDADIAEYVAKYGRTPKTATLHVKPDEVAYSVSKTARGTNLSVLDVLYLSAESAKHKALYKEYAHATKGRSQLQWSRGLMALLDIEIVRDEIAAEGVETETDRLLAKIEINLWKWISIGGHIGQVMTYANAGDGKKLAALLHTLKDKYQDDWQPNAVIDWGKGH